ncbi:hypothetical protein NRB_02030 [Novosphingobium sp. 11B]
MNRRANTITPVGSVPVGFAIDANGQRFDAVSSEPYRRLDGEMVTLTNWSAQCATCGEEFLQSTAPSRWPELRRCKAHRKPGVRVGGHSDER